MKLDGADTPTPVHVDGVPLVGTPGHVPCIQWLMTPELAEIG